MTLVAKRDRRVDALLRRAKTVRRASIQADVRRLDKLFTTALRDRQDRMAISYLAQVAIAESRMAPSAIVRGDAGGWTLAARSAWAESAETVLLEALDSGVGGSAAWMLLAGRNTVARRLMEELRATARRDAAVLEYNCFVAFMLELERYHREAPPGTQERLRKKQRRPLGPYDALIRAWMDPGRVARALPSVLDYHVEKAVDEGSAEFLGVLVLLPIELHCIRSVREAAGFEWVGVDHPLLHTPFATPPAWVFAPQKDERWRALLKVLRGAGWTDAQLAGFV